MLIASSDLNLHLYKCTDRTSWKHDRSRHVTETRLSFFAFPHYFNLFIPETKHQTVFERETISDVSSQKMCFWLKETFPSNQLTIYTCVPRYTRFLVSLTKADVDFCFSQFLRKTSFLHHAPAGLLLACIWSIAPLSLQYVCIGSGLATPRSTPSSARLIN